jgi:CRISPR-associated protein Csd1
MLLKHLYDFAVSRKLLDDLGFARKAVRWIIELDGEGNLLGHGPQSTGDDKRGKEYDCPRTIRAKVAGGVSEFLADGLTAVFGLDPDPEAPMNERRRADRDVNNRAKRDDFWGQIAAARDACSLPALSALLAFGSRVKTQPPSFLHWGKSKDGRSGKPAWWIISASGTETRLGSDNFTFRVNGGLLLEEETLTRFWRSCHEREVAEARAGFRSGVCLITGKPDQKLAPTHNPKIQGVPNTQSFGAAIVSFDKPAFASYGFDQSLNSPASDEAATAYCVALNHLIERDDHSVRLGRTTLCFWAAQTPVGKTPFGFLNRPDPKAVRDFVRSPFAGIERELARKDRFLAVTLAGNSGRIVVRHWLQSTLEEAVEHLHDWFADLAIDEPPRPLRKARAGAKEKEHYPLSVYWLACTTVREAKDLPPDVSSQLYRAALEGTAPSLALIKPLLDQLHSRLVRDESYNFLYDESCFSLLKLILNRNRKDMDMELKPALTADTDDPAYNCGRLLAILAAAQDKAHEFKLEGAGVAERYFGTASISPASVFPLLLRLNRHHLQKIGKSERYGGHERFIQEQIEAVLTLFRPAQPGQPPCFPRTLNLRAQGRFALGFYQQSAADATARQTIRSNNASSKPGPAAA